MELSWKTDLGTRPIGWESRQGFGKQLFLMCLETTYVLCREHIAFSKFIKYACECGKNMTVKMVLPTQWKHIVMLANPRGFMSQTTAARLCALEVRLTEV